MATDVVTRAAADTIVALTLAIATATVSTLHPLSPLLKP